MSEMKQEKISGTPTKVDEATAATAATAVSGPAASRRRWMRPR